MLDQKAYAGTQWLCLAFICTLICVHLRAVSQQREFSSLRVYIDNDFFACRNQDGAYTNGLRIDYWYGAGQKPRHPLARIMGLAADTMRLVIQGLSLSQPMFTANRIDSKILEPGDYPYSGALLLSYNFSSLDDAGQGFHAEIVAGVRGRYSLAAETQIAFHKLIGADVPQGWGSQLPTAWLANVNVAREWFVAPILDRMCMYVRGAVKAGSLMNSVSIAAMLRPCDFYLFKGPNFSPGRRYGCSVYFSPEVHYVASNALLQKSVFRREDGLANILFTTEAGLAARYADVAFSFSYKTHTGMIENQLSKAIGNVSLYVNLR